VANTKKGPGLDVRPLSLFGLGAELAAPVVLLAAAGYYLDSRWGSKPWLLIVGALLGSVVGLYTFIRRVTTATPGGEDGTES